MFKVVGCWELGWNTPICEYDLWAFPVRDFGCAEFIMTPVSGIGRSITEMPDVSEAILSNPELVPVFIDENGETPLPDFEHPKDALYILGKASFSPFASIGSGHASVRIPTSENKGLLWPHQAVTLVLYDRKLKLEES